ncbi:DUF3800 domain-containing protein [Gynuella sunshinyii]|uniref:3-deoxy-D-manno-octulosonic acid transferase n=1 Tax=Gynuella sunshinyii YC6258 TaxID=1445510 RepID=A0A0C5VRS5_9GAMM|nr:DUF3800 domain-containing protein [Gynuella sunshinyii]AJQ96936.1 hypothetical Protein YC6258_04904 [Gynuella sunshinyii YC6258]
MKIIDQPGSDYIVYVDESGDHSLVSIDSNYPVFVLAFCIFHKRHYAESVTTALTQFKFRHFGHDMVVLHEHDIRKEKNGFNFQNKNAKNAFLAELSAIIEEHNFVLISVAIHKQRLADQYRHPDNPYHIALKFCLERLYFFLREKNQQTRLTHIIFEKRGKKEDTELELEFRRLSNGGNRHNHDLPFELVFADKKTNSSGLQLADLVARPIGLQAIRPDQTNRAFEILARKLYSRHGREGAGTGYEGYGLKYFP